MSEPKANASAEPKRVKIIVGPRRGSKMWYNGSFIRVGEPLTLEQEAHFAKTYKIKSVDPEDALTPGGTIALSFVPNPLADDPKDVQRNAYA